VGVRSLGSQGRPVTFDGTSVAAPFVTGTIALLWSRFPRAGVAQIRLALTRASATRRRTITPPLLDAAAAYRAMLT
jgi:subtilisin family serine protease